MDFNTITSEQEKITVAKFKEYGKGVVMGRYNAVIADDQSAKWSDLVDATKYSVNAIKAKMREVAHNINNSCNDEMLGDTSIAYSFRDNRNKSISVTYLEMYTFLRAALRYRKETDEYKNKVSKLAEAKRFVEENKSQEDKMKEAQALVDALSKEVE